MDTPPLDAELLAAADLLDESESVTAWRSEARPQQLPPEGDWFVWLIMAGRGWGKTRTGAEWLAHRAQTTPGDYAVIGRSTQDTRETCFGVLIPRRRGLCRQTVKM
jgi:phage terminase large subunit-like protein